MIKHQKEIQRLFNSLSGDVTVDVLGNIIFHKSGSGNRIMIVAHYDVVSLMITRVDQSGFLHVEPSGGIDVSILPARRVVIEHEGKTVIGIIGKKPIHILRDNPSNKVSYDEIWVDIGANSYDEAMTMVSIGDYAYFSSEKEDMPNHLVTSSYCDNSVGINVLSNLAERIQSENVYNDIYLVASNYEEIGMRGAMVAAQSIRPDMCICVDVTHATDYPTMDHIRDGDIKLGKGCVLAKGPNIHHEVFRKLEDTALSKKIDYQIEVSPYPTGTDANMIQLAGVGVKTAVVSVPCRYMHTPHEICSFHDIESATTLINSFVLKGF